MLEKVRRANTIGQHTKLDDVQSIVKKIDLIEEKDKQPTTYDNLWWFLCSLSAREQWKWIKHHWKTLDYVMTEQIIRILK